MKFTSKVQNGKTGIGNEINKFLATLEGKSVVIQIEEETKKRSLAQDKYWFAVLDKYAVPIFRDDGNCWSSYDIHQYVMMSIGREKVLYTPIGKPFVVRDQSRGYNTKQWEEFMEEGRAFLATEHGIQIPLPNEKGE